jgi:hypothetical protein
VSSERVRATHTTAVQPTRAVLTALTPRRRPRRTRSLRPLRHVQPRVFWHAACIQSGRRASRAIVAAYKSPLVSRSYLLLHTCALARLTGSDSLGPAAVSVASRLRRSHTARRSRLSGRSRPTFGAGITAERLAASAERSTARAVRRDLLPGQSALFRYRLRGRWSTRKKPGLKVSFLTVLGGSRPSVAPCTPVSGRTASGSLGVRVTGSSTCRRGGQRSSFSRALRKERDAPCHPPTGVPDVALSGTPVRESVARSLG